MNEQTLNWRTMKPGRALDRLVAEQLGWHLEKVTWVRASSNDEGWMWALVTPEGKKASFGSADPEYAWFVPRNECPDEVSVPYYSTDANAALTLPTRELYFIALHGPTGDREYDNENQMWYCFIEWVFEDRDAPGYRGSAETPAVAVVRAWLAYTDANPMCAQGGLPNGETND